MALNFADPHVGTPVPILIHPADGGPVTIPEAALLFSADFHRDHGDLVLSNPGSPDIRIVDYFDAGTPPDLQSPEGAVIRGATVALLAGPEAPGQYAQAGAATAGTPIGQVETLAGEATVQRADGTVETLGPGSKIFLNDVLQTGADGRLAVTFVDGTIFTLSAASRMVVDNLIYDPASQSNSGGFNLIQGSFVFIAGQVARTGGMDVSTPSATMGIKGTTVLVEIDTDNGVATAQVTLLRDPDGHVGRVELFDLSQNLIATINEANASWVISTVDGETREVERGSAPDDTDSVLIADAVAAYQSAFGRVGAGGSFVELDNVLHGGSGGGGGDGQNGDSIDLDSDDDQELPELAPPPVAPPTGNGSFDEGRNGYVAPGPIRVTGDDSGSVVDGGATVADGRLAASEGDAGSSLVWSGSAEGTYGTFTISPAGDWRYVAKPAIAQLDEGQTAVESFTVTTTDGEGQTATQIIRISVVGAGDAPVSVTPEGQAQGAITEFVGATTGGQLSAADPDAGATLAWSGSGPGAFGTFTIAPDGTWTYVAGPAVQQLAEGQTAAETFTATVTDQTGRTGTQIVTVTITGAGDGPVSTTTPENASGAVTDGATLLAQGTLTATDPDAGAVLTWSGSAAGAYGSFTVAPNGAWTYVADPALRELDDGETATETFTATVTDETGRTATQAVTVTLIGAGDAPVSTTSASDASGIVTDGGALVASGTLTAADPDAGATLTWSGSGTGAYGTFTVAPNGAWTYVAGSNVSTLGEGQSATETFTATVTDETGRTATQLVTVTLDGAGDAPASTTTPGNAAGTVTDGGTLLATGTLTASDPDAGATLTWSGSATGTYGTFSVAPGGTWSYTANPAIRALAQGQTATETFTATVTDETGRTATQLVTVTLTGANDAPVSTTTPGNAAGTVTDGGALVAAGTLTASDPDAGATLTWSGGGTTPYGTFAVQPDGTWSFTGNSAIDALPKGATVTESFTATVTDDKGATATQTVVVTILGTNDAPVTKDGEFETDKGEAISGQLFASDVDTGDILTFSLGPKAPANGTVTIAADGSFTYTPAAGFQGLDTFDFSVSDGQGGTSTSRATVAVVSESGSSGGSSVSLDIQPEGTILSTATPVDATGVNLVIALDRSGSIGATEWQVQVNQVADALQALAGRFAGAATSVDVRIVAYSTTATITPTYNLTDPALIAAVRNLPYTGGTTNYSAALTATEAFFDSQPQGEANFLYFITDGQPTDSTWPTVLARLNDEATKGYDVQIEAFGIGTGINFTTLSQFDPNPELLGGASDLTDAFTATPLFSADLVSLKVELIADGVSQGVIATEDSAAVVSSGLITTLSVADITGIADLLGTSNRISATATYDLDGDPSTSEVELFASSVFEKADTAQTLTGTGGSDLLFGSDFADDLTGGAGNDILLGFGGNDVFRPGTGVDTVLGGAGDDRIIISTPETASAQGTERLDGGTGRDTLDVDFGGDVNTGLLDLVDLRGIEVIDMQNGQANTLRLTLSDVLGMSNETDSAIEALLGGEVPNARTILGDATDTLVLDGAQKTGTVADAAGNSFDIYTFQGGSDVLATLAVDADVTVTSQSAGT
ncbi:MAG: VCBS domain-containing protein [Rhodospirillaceae bacterium]